MFVLRPLLALLPLALAADAGAQVIRRGSFGAPPPTAWISGGVSHTGSWSVSDGATGARWEFGNATQYQASIEKKMFGASMGLRGTTAKVPLRYVANASGSEPLASEADANVSQLLAAVHVASGRGIHTVLELDAGATMYSNFRARTTGDRLRPSSDVDFAFSLGYGFGYGFSSRFAIELVQDRTTTYHQRAGLGASDDTNTRINGTRVVGRLGM